MIDVTSLSLEDNTQKSKTKTVKSRGRVQKPRPSKPLGRPRRVLAEVSIPNPRTK